jgi:predicted GNAT superfamily acetyltransferase
MAVLRFEYDIPLEQTMEFDAVYPPGLQFELPEKRMIRQTPGAIFVWMWVDDQLVGESYGVPISNDDEPIEGLDGLSIADKQNAIYCYSNTILPRFQRRGFGDILKAHWLGLVVSKGFTTVYGHARPGASQALNAKFGAIFLGDFPDWYGTGEAYKMYRLALGNAPALPQGFPI